MDAGYIVLVFLIGFIALMILWLVYGLSPVALLRSVFTGDMSILDMSSEAPDRTSSDAGSRQVEPVKITDTHQLEPNEPAVLEPPRDPLIISHKMSKKELTILLAAQKDGDGAYRFSANKIAEFIGGTSAEVKGWVAEVRGKREPAAATLRRPANGW